MTRTPGNFLAPLSGYAVASRKRFNDLRNLLPSPEE